MFLCGFTGEMLKLIDRPPEMMQDYGYRPNQAWCLSQEEYSKQIAYIEGLNHTIDEYEDMIHRFTCKEGC